MEFSVIALFICVVVLFVRSVNDRSVIRDLKSQLRDLLEKKEQNNSTLPQSTPAKKSQSPHYTPPQTTIHSTGQSTTQSPSPTTAQTTVQPALQAPPQALSQNSAQSLSQTPSQTPPQAPRYQHSGSIVDEDDFKSITNEPYKPLPLPAEDDEQGFEKRVGQRLFGILAAVMIFGALIYLAVQYYEYIGDAIKIGMMFAASAAVCAFGYLRSKKTQNSFTLAVTACGEGMFIVSTLLTRFWFEALNDVAVFVILAVWFAATLFIAKRLKAETLNFLSLTDVFIGMCLVVGIARSENMIPLAVMQLAATALVMIMCFIVSRRAFVFSLLGAMTTSLFTLALAVSWRTDVDYLYIPEVTVLVMELAAIIICTVLLILWIQKTYENESTACIITSMSGALIFIIAFLGVLFRLTDLSPDESEFIIPAVTIFASFAGMFALAGRHGTRENIRPFTAKTFIVTLAFSALIFNFIFIDLMPVNLPLFIPSAFVFIGLYAYSKNPIFAISSITTTFIAALDAMITRFSDLSDFIYDSPLKVGYIPIALVLYAVIFIIPVIQYKLLSDEHKRPARTPLQIVFILLSEIALFVLFAISTFPDNYRVFAFILPLGALALWFYTDRRSTSLTVFTAINEYAVLLSAGIILGLSDSPLMSLLIFLSVAALAAYRSRILIDHEMSGFGAVMFVIKWYGIIIAALSGFTIENAIVYSLVIMLAGALFIAGGYVFDLKSLRIMGLITALVCTLKLALVDVPMSNSSLRVIAMIIGGVMCFGISAVYAYFDKRFIKQSDREIL